MERERICSMGVPSAWGLSPKAPLDEYVTILFNIYKDIKQFALTIDEKSLQFKSVLIV